MSRDDAAAVGKNKRRRTKNNEQRHLFRILSDITRCLALPLRRVEMCQLATQNGCDNAHHHRQKHGPCACYIDVLSCRMVET